MLLLILWQITVVIQGFFDYGTAYRLTKNGGDNGVALFGWMIVLGLASVIPGLGIYGSGTESQASKTIYISRLPAS